MHSPLRYVGGKSRLVKTLVPIIDNTPHTCYCEPCGGAGWIMFAKNKNKSKVEVFNDADGELINFWRVVQRHHKALIDYLRYTVVSRQFFDWKKAPPPATLTDIERAANYYYLQRLAFGGKVVGRNFGYSSTTKPGLDAKTIGTTLKDVHNRISETIVEHLDIIDCITRYDRDTTLFFIDPPYLDVCGYAIPFPKERYAQLAKHLKKINGKFLLTLNDHEYIRTAFKQFNIQSINTRYSTGKVRNEVAEVLISNYDIAALLP